MLPLPSLPNISNFCHLNNRDYCWAIRIVFEGLNLENELPIFSSQFHKNVHRFMEKVSLDDITCIPGSEPDRAFSIWARGWSPLIMHTLSMHLAWGGHPLHPLTAHDAQKKNYFATAHMLRSNQVKLGKISLWTYSIPDFFSVFVGA